MLSAKPLQKINALFSSISLPVMLLNEHGISLVPDNGQEIQLPDSLPVGENVSYGSYTFRRLKNRFMPVLCVPRGENSGDMLVLLENAVVSCLQDKNYALNAVGLYTQLLRRELSPMQLAEAAEEASVSLCGGRTVLVLILEGKKSAYSLLNSVFPKSGDDVLLSMSHNQAVLIKDMQSLDGADEMLQYAQALQETLQQEIGMEALIGIGDEKTKLSALGSSYEEALQAIEAGRVFRSGEKIHMYRHLLLERFLMGVSKDKARSYYRVLFNENSARLFTPEMLQTVTVFFEKDLNLSDTSRALFIHRNTLVYRLEKILKQTGLDLRRFNDAVVFKILCELKTADEEKTQQLS